jgi:hypothetical protein
VFHKLDGHLSVLKPLNPSTPISARFVFLKKCAVNKNRLFLLFLYSKWIPLMCLQTGKGGGAFGLREILQCCAAIVKQQYEDATGQRGTRSSSAKHQQREKTE